jgi:hypothetical protein
LRQAMITVVPDHGRLRCLDANFAALHTAWLDVVHSIPSKFGVVILASRISDN